uniref:Uncharacterized protein n=1 Tax=virus sp. ctyMK1 TaxID=2828002 RepID=A0A8S5RF16_9VIRU|nr:MAG TPA: hypothetical protein [virus sp. ctyMK1]
MSKWIEEKDGRTITTIADMEECSYMYNDNRCNDKSERRGEFPRWEDCTECPLFEKEEGLEDE